VPFGITGSINIELGFVLSKEAEFLGTIAEFLTSMSR